MSLLKQKVYADDCEPALNRFYRALHHGDGIVAVVDASNANRGAVSFDAAGEDPIHENLGSTVGGAPADDE